MTTLPPDLSPDELDEELVQLVTELSMAAGYQGQITIINSDEEWEALAPKAPAGVEAGSAALTMAMDEDNEPLLIPAHLRAQARRECEGAAPSSTDDYFSHPRWVFPSKRPVQPRCEIACMLRAADRRRGATDSLKAINYGPVELRLRKLLALLNWRRWWR
jgi:hypothetical protein